ncbi:MAG: hypothetical protein AB1611_01865 [bacterium]
MKLLVIGFISYREVEGGPAKAQRIQRIQCKDENYGNKELDLDETDINIDLARIHARSPKGQCY